MKATWKDIVIVILILATLWIFTGAFCNRYGRHYLHHFGTVSQPVYCLDGYRNAWNSNWYFEARFPRFESHGIRGRGHR
jgi:hypothetical protein